MMLRGEKTVKFQLKFVFSVILLGLSGYRVHYTKSLANGDILTTSTHFYGGSGFSFRSRRRGI